MPGDRWATETALRVEGMGNSEAVFVYVKAGDEAVLDHEVQGKPCAIGTSRGPGGLADLAEHDGVVAIYHEAFDRGARLLGYVVLGKLAEVGGRVGTRTPVTDPRCGGAIVLGLGPVQSPVVLSAYNSAIRSG